MQYVTNFLVNVTFKLQVNSSVKLMHLMQIVVFILLFTN